MEGDNRAVLEPDFGHIQHGAQQGSLEAAAHFSRVHLHLQRDIQTHRTVYGHGGAVDHGRGVRVVEGVPFVAQRLVLTAKRADHHVQRLEQLRDLRVERKEQRHVGHRPDRQQRHLAGVAANRLAQKADGVPVRKFTLMRPAVQGRRLWGQRLARRNQERQRCAGEDGHNLAGGATDGVGKHGALVRLAAHRGNPQQLALRLGQQIGQTDGVVNIAADVGVKK